MNEPLTLIISTCGEGSWLFTSSTSPTATHVDSDLGIEQIFFCMV